MDRCTMNIIITIALSFVMIFLGMLFAVGWVRWYPKTRCQTIKTSSNETHNVCIKNRSHDGPHMTASGRLFRDSTS